MVSPIVTVGNLSTDNHFKFFNDNILVNIFANLKLSDLKNCAVACRKFKKAVELTQTLTFILTKIQPPLSSLDFSVWNDSSRLNPLYKKLILLDESHLGYNQSPFIVDKLKAAWNVCLQDFTRGDVFILPWNFHIPENQFKYFTDSLIKAKYIKHFVFEEGLTFRQAEVFKIALKSNKLCFQVITFGMDLKLSSKAFCAICEGIKENKSLEAIKFDKVKEKTSRFIAIGKVITCSKSLKKIKICGRVNDTTIFSHVINALIAPHGVQECIFSQIGTFQIDLIIQKVHQLRVKHLWIERCAFDEKQCNDFAANILKSSHLKKLTIGNCHVNQNHFEKITQAVEVKNIEFSTEMTKDQKYFFIMGQWIRLRF